jgi:hypothetical protein
VVLAFEKEGKKMNTSSSFYLYAVYIILIWLATVCQCNEHKPSNAVVATVETMIINQYFGNIDSNKNDKVVSDNENDENRSKQNIHTIDNDFDKCTIQRIDSNTGEIVLTPIDCDDMDPTTLDFCVEGECRHTKVKEEEDTCKCTRTVCSLETGGCMIIPVNCGSGKQSTKCDSKNNEYLSQQSDEKEATTYYNTNLMPTDNAYQRMQTQFHERLVKFFSDNIGFIVVCIFISVFFGRRNVRWIILTKYIARVGVCIYKILFRNNYKKYFVDFLVILTAYAIYTGLVFIYDKYNRPPIILEINNVPGEEVKEEVKEEAATCDKTAQIINTDKEPTSNIDSEISKKAKKHKSRCIICMNSTAIVACIPCGHILYCTGCTKDAVYELDDRGRKCAICSAKVKSYNKLFFT